MTGETTQEETLNDHSIAHGQTFTLQALAELSGFPIELLKKELLFDQDLPADAEISLDELRHIMLKYLDLTMLHNK